MLSPHQMTAGRSFPGFGLTARLLGAEVAMLLVALGLFRTSLLPACHIATPQPS
jgi:hypothetical protein